MENTSNKPKSATNECVRRLRRELGLSVRAFAERLGVHYSAVAHWEGDTDEPSERAIAGLSILAGSKGKPELAHAFTLLLSGSRLGRIFMDWSMTQKQVKLIEGQLKHAKLLLANADVKNAQIMINYALEMATGTLKEIEHNAHLAPQRPEVEYRAGRNTPVLN